MSGKLRKGVKRRLFIIRVRAKWKAWSWQNWSKGYKFGPVQRFRCCDHTTPAHYAWCANMMAEGAPWSISREQETS